MSVALFIRGFFSESWGRPARLRESSQSAGIWGIGPGGERSGLSLPSHTRGLLGESRLRRVEPIAVHPRISARGGR
jgi:hypothetical protein